MYRIFLALLLGFGPTASPAQTFTTAAEIKPILTASKSGWIAVREYDGNDLLYFTNALAWRCGLTAIRYGINGAPAETDFAMEPCYEGEAVPNAIKGDGGLQIYVTLPLKSVETVTVTVVFDDGTTDSADYARTAILTP
jgi:hypothetical protein